MKTKTNQHNKPRYRKKLPYTIRYIAVGIITILLLLSLFSVYSAYQTPTTRTAQTPILTYENRGRFDYTLFLFNNTLYNNNTFLKPEEGPFFRQLIDHINASFIYTYQISQNATINGDYSIDAVLQTNFWEKTYPLVEKTPFTAQGKRASFTAQFPVDFLYYEQLFKTINDETGVTAQNPRLRFQTRIFVSASTTNKTTTSLFSPSIEMTLGQKTIEFTETLTSMQPGSVTEEIIIDQPEIVHQRNIWTFLLILFAIALPAFVFFTANREEPETKTEKQIRKIKKKYGEWIVETHTRPKQQKRNIITVNSLEDLSKVSEELGKPILLYASPQTNKYQFYVLEDHLMYLYEFKVEQKKIRVVAICPKCNKENYYEGHAGKKISVVCANCGHPGAVSISLTKRKHMSH